jgi:type IV secretory pathway VirD2 relaxase
MLIESELGNALSGSVKRKGNSTRKLRSTAKRVSTHSSEVMVKVTGFGKGAGHVHAHLDYISRNGKVELENDRGEILTGKDEVNAFFKDWEKDFGDSKRHKNQRDTMHLVLSMPETVDSESVRSAARAFAQSTFGQNHEYVFALHTDEPHPHCHVTVKCLGFDGTRLNPRKDDLQAWREGFAEKLRDQGVDAEATPRRARGVVKKAEPNVIRHIEQGDKSHKPRVSRVRAAKIKEAAQELTAEAKGLPVPAKPWEEAIVARQREIRRAWLAAAEALDKEDPRLTFNQKVPNNARPDYERISAEHARSGLRAAAVYQSHLEKPGRQVPAQTLASVRNLSGVGVVHQQRSAQMLLHPNASDRLGQRSSANSEIRRARTGDSRAPGGSKQLAGQPSIADENKVLAGRIRAFVGAMPTIETERQQLKRELVQKFTRQAEHTHVGATVQPVAPAPGVDKKKGADQAAPHVVGKDVER